MAVHFNGKNARVIYNGATIACLQNWEANVTSTFTEGTCAEGKWTTVHRGFVSWTASAESIVNGVGSDVGFEDGEAVGFISGSDITSETPLTLKLYPDGGSAGRGYYEGTAYLAEIGASSGSTDNPTFKYSFEGTGKLLFKTA